MRHKKMTGACGEIYVAHDLLKQGYCVFKELGDNSHIDLIAIINKKTIRIQVKTTNVHQNPDLSKAIGSLVVHLQKTGPNGYKYEYAPNEVDVFAIYVENKNTVLYVSARQLENKKTFSIRFDVPRNAQNTKINMYNKYLNIIDCIQ